MPNWRIMIVDDEQDLLDLLKSVLETKFEVVMAHNGLDALEKLERYEPDFVILDVMMPLMDGFDTCAALRKNPLYRETPIYFLTSSSSREEVKKGYALGCNLYLQKPFDPFRLLKNIEFHLEKNPIEPKKKKYSIRQLEQMDKAPPAHLESKADAMATPVRVMIIDDNEETVKFLEFGLKKAPGDNWKFEPIVSSSPVDALSQIVHYQPDIIVLDIRMPKLDGFQLCKIIQINQNLKDTEIQFISASTMTKDAEYALRLTGNQLLVKPFELDQIRKAMTAICEKPGFHIKTKRLSFDEIQRELKREEQKIQEEIRKQKEKKALENRLHPIKDFYKELQKEEGVQREDKSQP